MKTGLNKFVLKPPEAGVLQSRFGSLVVVLCLMLFFQVGCQSPTEYRLGADKAAGGIIQKKLQSIGRTEQFSIERAGDILRRRLLTEQNLPYAGPSSLGADRLETIEHWPEDDYPKAESSLDPIVMLEDTNKPLQLSLIQALQTGARNSFEYQTRKEDIFKEALGLDLERNEFRNIFATEVESLIETDMSGGRTVSGVEYSGAAGVSSGPITSTSSVSGNASDSFPRP